MRKFSNGSLLLAALPLIAAAQPAYADIVIGPRFSYYFDNSNLRTSDQQGFEEAATFRDEEREAELQELFELPVSLTATSPTSAILADQIGFPMAGGMINFGNDRDRFTFTAMYGEGDGSAEIVSSRKSTLVVGFQEIRDIEISNFVGSSAVDRLDVEATWQRRVNENFAITGGIRYERLDTSDAGTLVVESTDQILAVVFDDPFLLGVTPPDRYDVETRATYQTFTARIGGTAFVPVDQSINAFFSGMAQVGYRPSSDVVTVSTLTSSPVPLPEPRVTTFTGQSSSEFSIGPDMAVGLQWIITDNLALDMRYRAVVFFPLSGDFSFSDAQVNHGVNIGVSLRL